MKTFDDLIHVNPNALSKKVCKDIIKRFEKDDRKKQGIDPTRVGSGVIGNSKDVKKCVDLRISNLEDWKDIDNILFKSSDDNLKEYLEKIKVSNTIFFNSNKLQDSGYLVKRYKPGDYFLWHSDRSYNNSGWSRVVACVWYLNDITEGGYTEFAHGRKIYPKTGQLIMFPTSWTFPHRAVTPKVDTKYVITSFLYTRDSCIP